jgi:hypothetical protein
METLSRELFLEVHELREEQVSPPPPALPIGWD